MTSRNAFAVFLSLSLLNACDSSRDPAPGSDSGPAGDGGGVLPGDDAGAPAMLCSDTCPSANDGECDDGGPGSLFSVCALGTDCGDCGPRTGMCTPSCAGRECGSDGCGGSCGSCSSGTCTASGTCSSTSCDPSAPGRCEGNVAVRCDDIGGIPVEIRETCSGERRCEAGACMDVARPTAVTISASFGDVDPIFVGEDPAGVLTVAGPPSFSVELPSLPNLFDAVPESFTPSAGDCMLSTGFTLNSSQVSASMSGRGPACVVAMTRYADDGFQVTFRDVEYQDGRGTLDVTLELNP